MNPTTTQTAAAPAKPAAAVPGPELGEDSPHFGRGGSYRYDPATGKTVLLQRADAQAQPDATADQSPPPA